MFWHGEFFLSSLSGWWYLQFISSTARRQLLQAVAASWNFNLHFYGPLYPVFAEMVDHILYHYNLQFLLFKFASYIEAGFCAATTTLLRWRRVLFYQTELFYFSNVCICSSCTTDVVSIHHLLYLVCCVYTCVFYFFNLDKTYELFFIKLSMHTPCLPLQSILPSSTRYRNTSSSV